MSELTNPASEAVRETIEPGATPTPEDREGRVEYGAHDSAVWTATHKALTQPQN
jgi:hypothetical protein